MVLPRLALRALKALCCLAVVVCVLIVAALFTRD
jgi:hypothetical protein